MVSPSTSATVIPTPNRSRKPSSSNCSISSSRSALLCSTSCGYPSPMSPLRRQRSPGRPSTAAAVSADGGDSQLPEPLIVLIDDLDNHLIPAADQCAPLLAAHLKRVSDQLRLLQQRRPSFDPLILRDRPWATSGRHSSASATRTEHRSRTRSSCQRRGTCHSRCLRPPKPRLASSAPPSPATAAASSKIRTPSFTKRAANARKTK